MDELKVTVVEVVSAAPLLGESGVEGTLVVATDGKLFLLKGQALAAVAGAPVGRRSSNGTSRYMQCDVCGKSVKEAGLPLHKTKTHGPSPEAKRSRAGR